MNYGIYIHLPYCLTKCPYCDFNSYGVGDDYPEDQYTDAVTREIDSYGNLLDNKTVSSVFFGGGTPSLFMPESIYKILDTLKKYTIIDGETEITLEINPRTADLEKLNKFRNAGVNRASVGIQSFSERKLEFYGRNCGPKDCRNALEDVISAGFKNFNIDLIYGSSNETVEELEEDLEISIKYGSTHLSAYCLTIEDGTQFGYMYKKGLLKLPEDEILSTMYYIVSDTLENNGFAQYEISNFTKPGTECIQNLKYWNCDTYIGFGAGAHSHVKGSGKNGFWGKRWGNIKNPVVYMNHVYDGRLPVQFDEKLERDNALADWIMMGLRLSGGVELINFKDRFNSELDREKLDYLINDRLLEMTEKNLKITRQGRIYSNLLIEKVIDSVVL